MNDEQSVEISPKENIDFIDSAIIKDETKQCIDDVKFIENNIDAIEPGRIPAVVDKRLRYIEIMEKKVKDALDKAQSAKELADKAKQQEIRHLLSLFSNGDTRNAIKALQNAMVGVADAQGELTDAVNKLLEYQREVADGMRFLLALGVHNVANSRLVIKRLKIRLHHASEEELNQMARQDILNVIMQIQRQMDLQKRQSQLVVAHNRTQNLVESNKRSIVELKEHEKAQDRELTAHKQTEERLEREIERRVEKDMELDDALQKQVKKDIEHDVELRRQAVKDSEHDAELKRQAVKDAEHDTELKRQAGKDKEHDAALAEIRKILQKHQFALVTADRVAKMCKLGLVIAIVALIVSILTAIALFVHFAEV